MKDHERAMQAWSALALAATNRQILTYEMLAQAVGVPARGLANILDHVALYCKHRGFPALTTIVVRRDKGRPGSGFWAVEPQRFPLELMRVFDHDWLVPKSAPTPELLDQLRHRKRARGTAG